MNLEVKILTDLTETLKARGCLPGHIEATRIGDLSIVSVYDHRSTTLMPESVATGMDSKMSVATAKALTEWIERRAFKDGFKNELRSCLTERSDGFAAFPTANENSNNLVREIALSEAIERFVWARWWDDHSIKFCFDARHAEDIRYWNLSYSLLEKLNEFIEIERFIEIQPEFTPFPDKELVIFVGEVKNHGVVTGGACGPRGDRLNTLNRAAGELFRHAMAARRLLDKSVEPESFYERRLAFLLSSNGRSAFHNRIAIQGTQPVILPHLVVDEIVPHKFNQVVTVHRCLFESQPPFIGGKLERMCL